MRHWRLLISVALLIALCALPVFAAGARAAGDSGYLALGDSYAYGVGASNPATLGYAGRFAATRGLTLTNLAMPGASSADLIGDYATRGRAGQSQLARATRALAAGTASVVTIDIGGNDILRLLGPGQPCNGQALGSDACVAAAQENLRAITARNLPVIFGGLVDAAPAGTQIIVLTYPNAFSVGSGLPVEQRTDTVIQALNALITGAAAQLRPRAAAAGVTLTTVDLFPLFVGKAGTLTHIRAPQPDIHPTDAGHATIAEALGAAYRPVALPGLPNTGVGGRRDRLGLGVAVVAVALPLLGLAFARGSGARRANSRWR